MDNFGQFVSTTRNFVKRDLKVRYSQSILGPIWVVLHPLLLSIVTAIIFSLAFKTKVSDVPYYIFVLIGYLNWGFFNQSVRESTGVLIANRNLVVNANFPLESLVVSKQLSRLVDWFMGLGIVILWLSLSGFKLHWFLFAYLFVVFFQLLFQLGLSLVSAALNVYYRDTFYAIEVALNLWFYLTPIIYPLTIVPEKFRWLIALNPIARVIILSRQIILEKYIDVGSLVNLTITAMICLLIGIFTFRKLKLKFADVI
jgi:lipopolysaccharide transport system permease protein